MKYDTKVYFWALAAYALGILLGISIVSGTLFQTFAVSLVASILLVSPPKNN